ncbi:M15 family metallopeptidase [Tenacibaculum sp. IB213877]|uniref:M15 family metallopeptidase n=1 Tax=Tenacibaculum sp. IB213877 TaxID=3097351 RepID=UPI002A59D527|nr:M15 family metallopeptidase [Tenacibaculum sp. IB213877]MDY0779952.1 M15 family metallopeptidase [Tenacibaculum sp. IB213877]
MKWIFSLLFSCIAFNNIAQNLPEGFSYIQDLEPTIQQELRYCSHNNFTGVPVDGYEESVLITSTPTALALQKVQQELLQQGYSLKIFDAYRPQQAVNHFVRWAKDINDTIMKKQFYPAINKRYLFKLGYIATKSGHSRGSSVDLTIINHKTGEELDMGSPYDFFGKISHLNYQNLTQEQKNNRFLLQKMMKKHGFRPYINEWWHFTLRNEPFPKKYFNFPIK